jgi:hypothetical protein
MRALAIACVLVGLAACHQKRVLLRPLSTGSFGGYEISECPAGGHLVKRTGELAEDLRGEVNSRERIENYRDRYMKPALKRIDMEIDGYAFDDKTCAQSKLVLRVEPERSYGEALHRIGETLRGQPTDIDVVLVLVK